jgi:hypothetical protein
MKKDLNKAEKSLVIIVKFLLAFVLIFFILYPTSILSAQEEDCLDNFIYLPKIQQILKERKIIPGTQKGVYLTGHSMGLVEKREEIYQLIEQSELNSIVFNAKDDSGFIDYDTDVKLAEEIGAEKKYYDLDEILAEMDERGIYSIARVVVFKDSVLPKARPDLAIKNAWSGKPLYTEGTYWPDIYCEQVWDYNIEIVKELAEHGVDEIQFDYIRSPARKDSAGIEYTYNTDDNTKTWAILGFLEKVRDETEQYNIKISADVFGWIFIADNDQGIGQKLEEIVPYLDYIYPMTYPSHYSPYFLGYEQPAQYPYEVVKYTLNKGMLRIKDSECIVIPWIQAFSLKVKYSEKDVLSQISAAEQLGIEGFLFWNAVNKYGMVERALEIRRNQNQ